VTPAIVEEVSIPATYTTVTRQVLVKDETVSETTVAAVYEDIQVKHLVKQGGLTYWKRECSVNCVTL